MSKNQKRSYLVSAVTLALLFAAFLLVFRDALPDILANLCAVPLWGVLLLPVLGFAYEGMEAAVALVLLRRKKMQRRIQDEKTDFGQCIGAGDADLSSACDGDSRRE